MIFDDGFDALEESLPWLYVSYQRGLNVKQIRAVRGGTSWLDLQRYGSNGMESSSRDYIVRAEDFETPPAARDQIHDRGETWTVVAGMNNECWRYCGPDRRLMRIHCRR